MDAEQVILSRGLPKTGQTEIYKAGDDGSHQAGWWQGIKEPRTRFVAKTIGVNGDKVVIDLVTGLMWAADGNADGCNKGLLKKWDVCITYANLLNFAGFDDWRMPNANELLSIVKYNRLNPSTYPTFFTNTKFAYYWSSTTLIIVHDNVWVVDFIAGGCVAFPKINSYNLRCVRKGV